MKKKAYIISLAVLFAVIFILFSILGCNKTENTLKYQYGTFPDTVYNLEDLNTVYNDYNSTCYLLGMRLPIIFSSDRGSSGAQFDYVQGALWFEFNQTTGAFSVGGDMTYDQFYGAVANRASTPGDDLGPYSLFSSLDSYEYFISTSEGTGGQLDLYYVKHLPRYSNTAPAMVGPLPLTVLNSGSDDAYFCFDTEGDSAYLCSNRDGDFDIYVRTKPVKTALDVWFGQDFEPSTPVDKINSEYEEKCPFIINNIMLFASNRLGGMGGYDLYYSFFRNGNWSTPINLGPKINTESNEFRPIIGYHQDFTNLAMIFSSDNPSGNGGFDLYFTGVSFPELE